MYNRLMKRVFDIVFSISLILLCLPLFLIISILIFIVLGSPVLFKQQRPGLHEKTFTIYKFRTMHVKQDKSGNPLPDHQRITKFGSFLRKTSIDELPELLNVLKGDMSLVGPRPLIIRYLPYYTQRERIRHRVRPGITGLAQVNGRNFLDWDKRLELDAWYVENLSFSLDFRILLKSVGKVIRREGIGLESIPDLDVLRRDSNIDSK